MSKSLIDFLLSTKLKIQVIEESSKGLIVEFSVLAKPASRLEKIYVNEEGNLAIQTRAKPVDGEANQAIIESASDLVGVPKYQVEILRGDKSKNKRIRILMDLTTKKTVEHYRKRISRSLS